MPALRSPPALRLPDAWQRGPSARWRRATTSSSSPHRCGQAFISEHISTTPRPRQVIFTVRPRAATTNRRVDPPGLARRHHHRDSLRSQASRRRHPRGTANAARPALYVVDEYQVLGDPMRGNHYEAPSSPCRPRPSSSFLSGSVANQPPSATGSSASIAAATSLSSNSANAPSARRSRDRFARPQHPRRHYRLLGAPHRGALRDDLGPILVFAPHRKEAKKSPATSPRASRARNRSASPAIRKMPPVPTWRTPQPARRLPS